MKCLVTGGAGFIGSNLVEELLKLKHEVVVIDDLSTGRKENIEDFLPDFEFYEETILNFERLKKIAHGCEIIFHQAAIPSVVRSLINPQATSVANIEGTLNVLLCARDLGIKRVVCASSSSVYGETKVMPKREDLETWPKSPYALTKLVGEHYCRIFSELYGLETICLRYFNVYGPKQNPNSPYAAVIPSFIKSVSTGIQPVIHGDGEQTRDFTFVKDVVLANILAAKAKINKPEVINIAGGKNISINKLLEKISELLDSKVIPIHDEVRKGDVRYALADITLAKKVLKFNPGYTLEKGLKETINWFRRQNHQSDKFLFVDCSRHRK